MSPGGAGRDVRGLESVAALKGCRAGERVSFRARVLRVWEVAGQAMCLVGDQTALTRVELAGQAVVPGGSYEFRNALVREFPARRPGAPTWHSASLMGGEAVPLGQEVSISQTDEYIERTYRILAGVHRKRARREGLLGPWQHPARGGGEPSA